MLKFLVIVGCLLAIANVGVFGGLIASAPALAIKPAAIAVPTIAAAPIIKGAPWGNSWGNSWGIASAPWGQPAIGLGAPLGLGNLKLG